MRKERPKRLMTVKSPIKPITKRGLIKRASLSYVLHYLKWWLLKTEVSKADKPISSHINKRCSDEKVKNQMHWSNGTRSAEN